jgi:hypothetical protein
MLSGVMPSVVMLSSVAPSKDHGKGYDALDT